MSGSFERRRAAYRLGLKAEYWAAAALMAKGYRLLAIRVGGKGGEIDLVVRRGPVIAFVEVKARADRDIGLTAVTPAKIRLIGRTARLWIARHPWAAELTWRGDLVVVSGWRWPHHVKGAFEITM